MTELILRVAARDRAVLVLLLERRGQRLAAPMRLLTHAGGAAATLGSVAGATALAPHARAVAVTWFALVTSHLAVQLLKRLIARPRPQLPHGVAALAAAPDRFSFPSGHAAAALSVALGLGLLLPAAAAALLACLGLLVGFTRCYLGVHYPGDVLVGWGLAVLAVVLGLQVC